MPFATALVATQSRRAVREAARLPPRAQGGRPAGERRSRWERAGVADRIELKIGSAVETLRALPADFEIDCAFIDADKTSYPLYYEEIVRRMRPGGVIAIDNVCLGGEAFDPAFAEPEHVAMRQLSDSLIQDDRVDTVLLPVRDGLTVVRRR